MTRIEKYKALCEKVKEHYREKNDSSFMWADDNEEINLWTYWQGRGHYSPKILLVGQDWGCANIEEDERAKQSLENIKEINVNPDHSYFYGLDRNMYVTDKHLKILFSKLGYDIEKERECEDLFFTNLCLGYRRNGNSGNFEAMWKAHKDFDMECFAELVDIFQPKIILCLGRSVYKGVMQSLKRKPAIESSYNKCIEKMRGQPPKMDNDVAVFPLAHPGSLGSNNRNKGTKEKGLKLQIEDWKSVGSYINRLNALGRW